MNQILDKLGIYDLVGVLLSGISITFFTMIVIWEGNPDLLNINLRIQKDEMVPFLIISYFVGLVFQEISSILHKRIIYPENKLLRKTLYTKENSLKYITGYEIDKIYSYVENVLHISSESEKDEVIYNYCKYYMVRKEKTANIDKDQSISGFSRSLSLYFFLLGVVLFVLEVFQIENKNLIVVILLMISVLLYFRCIRFAKIRYSKVLRAFYYDVIANKDMLGENQEVNITVRQRR